MTWPLSNPKRAGWQPGIDGLETCRRLKQDEQTRNIPIVFVTEEEIMTLPIELTGAKVLIVDDTPENLKLLRQTLETEGYSILVATNGEAALKIVRRASPDLILLDVMMPGIDGFETCRRLKQDVQNTDIPVLFITARAETEAIVEGFQAGGVDYIVKPFQDREVLMRVRSHLQINRLARELEKTNGELHETNEQLRHSRRAGRIRALRPCEGSLHRSRQRAHGLFRTGRRGHAFPG